MSQYVLCSLVPAKVPNLVYLFCNPGNDFFADLIMQVNLGLPKYRSVLRAAAGLDAAIKTMARLGEHQASTYVKRPR